MREIAELTIGPRTKEKDMGAIVAPTNMFILMTIIALVAPTATHSQTVVAMSSATAATAQAGSAMLSGQVTDVTGAVIVGATVTATRRDTSFERQATTGADGVYRIDQLQPGLYTIIASYPGFAVTTADVQLDAGSELAVPLQLRVAVQAADIMVYGEKVEEDLMDTSASVGVISSVQLGNREMWRVEDAFRQVANVNFADWIDAGIVIRGVNSEGIGGPSGSPLATTYLDGVPQTQNGVRRGANGTWDLEQIEVWRGPQSTLSGRNALAGTVQIRSKDPTMEWEAAARAGFGNSSFDSQAIALSGPILQDKLAFRISAEQQSRDGEVSYPNYTDFPKLRERAEDDYHLVRGKLLFVPTQQNRARFLATFASSYDSPSYEDVDGPSADVAYEDRVWGQQVVPVFVEARSTRNNVGSLEADFALSESWSLKSTTGYLVTDTRRPSIDLASDGQIEEQQFSEELILSQTDDHFNSVIGFFYLNEDTTDNRDQKRPWEQFVRHDRRNGTVDNVAFFGQTQWYFNDPWSVTVGLRYDRETQEFRTQNSRVALDGSLISDSSGSTDASFGALLPKFGIGYALSDDSDLGFTVQRGYRAGGSAINFLNSEVYDYDPEYAWNYEFSYRGQFVDRWLFRYRANVFYMDWSGQQVNLPQIAGNFQSDIIINAGESRVIGAELELDWQLTNGFALNSSLGIADTEFKDFSFIQFGQLRDLSGLPFPQAPGVTGHLGAEYRHRTGWFASGDLTYSGTTFSRSLLEAGLEDELDAYALLNLRGGWDRGQVRISVWADNLTDKTYFRYRYDDPGFQLATLGRGRAVGVTLDWALD